MIVYVFFRLYPYFSTSPWGGACYPPFGLPTFETLSLNPNTVKLSVYGPLYILSFSHYTFFFLLTLLPIIDPY